MGQNINFQDFMNSLSRYQVDIAQPGTTIENRDGGDGRFDWADQMQGSSVFLDIAGSDRVLTPEEYNAAKGAGRVPDAIQGYLDNAIENGLQCPAGGGVCLRQNGPNRSE